ncbi:hypothetical protein F5884DRAFT_858627 [Xylogone sp. PMI_703]|nr:hypothetical protein F5884DRAFT_858627 [Xylogone sp. PMI_703]
MTAVYNSQDTVLRFADFKFSSADYTKIPDVTDVTAIDDAGQLMLAAELKVPWVKAHHLEYLVHKDSKSRQAIKAEHLLTHFGYRMGQSAEYLTKTALIKQVALLSDLFLSH